MTNYKNKYLKYKLKYVTLKEELGENVTKCIEKGNNTNSCIETNGRILLVKLINYYLNKFCIEKKSDDKYYITDKCKKTEMNVPFTWNNYKRFLLDEKRENIYIIRKKIVDRLINFIFDNYPECKVDDNKICIFGSSGSIGPEATLFSDYDLTLSGNYKISEIIQMFNSIFESEFNEPSSVIFDTNLYGYSFLIVNNAIKENFKLWTPLYKDLKQHELYTYNILSIEQDKWAYLRILSHFNNTINNILELNITEYNEYYQRPENNLESLTPKQKQDSYIKYMSEFEKLMSENKDNLIIDDNINNIKNKIIDTLSNMNYYGDETYFTQGAFMHVVGLMYLKHESKKDKLSLFKKPYYLIHSMMENLGYFIHSYYGHDIIYAIKYYNRFINAYYWFNKIYNEEIKNKDLSRIKQLGILTENIKSYIRNRDDTYVSKYKTVFGDFINIEGEESIVLFKNEIIETMKKLIKKISNNSEQIVEGHHYYLLSLLYFLMKTLEIGYDYTSIRLTYENNIYKLSQFIKN